MDEPFYADLAGFGDQKSKVHTDVTRSQLGQLLQLQVWCQTNFLTQHSQDPTITMPDTYLFIIYLFNARYKHSSEQKHELKGKVQKAVKSVETMYKSYRTTFIR